MATAEQVYFSDDFVNVIAGEPFRLFKFGKLVKGGKIRELTDELLRKFKLPHFKPPIKLGSHDDATPAGGHITGLEVREDGLYAHNEMNEEGVKALEQGSYKYHSPEVIWDEDGGYEDPTSGDIITGPLIVGAAFTHTPHLGEAAALYSYEPVKVHKPENGEKIMPENTVQIPQTLLDKFMSLFDKPEPEIQPEEKPEVVPADEFAAAVKERDDYKSKIEELEAEKLEATNLAAIKGEFDTEDFGAKFQAIPEEEGAVDMLATMDEDQRGWVITQFKAMSAQINESELLGEKGSAGKPVDLGNLNEIVQKRAKADGIDYNSALALVFAEVPELAVAKQDEVRGKK